MTRRPDGASNCGAVRSASLTLLEADRPGGVGGGGTQVVKGAGRLRSISGGESGDRSVHPHVGEWENLERKGRGRVRGYGRVISGYNHSLRTAGREGGSGLHRLKTGSWLKENKPG